MLEAGLVEHYKLETWYGMRKDYLESDEEKVVYDIRPNISPMSLDDLQGAFYIGGLFLAMAFVTFLLEKCIFWTSERNKNENYSH